MARVDLAIWKPAVSFVIQHQEVILCVNITMAVIQILMQATNGLGVILENRYYGESFPFNTSSTDELRFLTTEQSKSLREFRRKHV